jgi:hypothetical protein
LSIAGFKKVHRSSSSYCHGFGLPMPCSRSFCHCCIIKVVGPHPFVLLWTTQYAVMINSIFVQLGLISAMHSVQGGLFRVSLCMQ